MYVPYAEFRADPLKFFKLSAQKPEEPVCVGIGGHMFRISLVDPAEVWRAASDLYREGIKSGLIKEEYGPGELLSSEDVARELGIELTDPPAELGRSGPT